MTASPITCDSVTIELYSDYDCKIRYHPGKANVTADVLSRKEIVKPKRVRAMNIILESSIKDMIPTAQKEAINESAGLQKGLDEMIEQRNDGTLYYLDQIWVPLKGDVRTLIMDEAHKSKYYVHPGTDKMYYDLRDRYWWPGMKMDIDEYVKSKLCHFLSLRRRYASLRFNQPMGLRRAIIEELEVSGKFIGPCRRTEHLKHIQKAVFIKVIDLKKELCLQVPP
ncbi:putative reverse transcriptase domain-containing protein [Tanacetum coccineum]